LPVEEKIAELVGASVWSLVRFLKDNGAREVDTLACVINRRAAPGNLPVGDSLSQTPPRNCFGDQAPFRTRASQLQPIQRRHDSTLTPHD